MGKFISVLGAIAGTAVVTYMTVPDLTVGSLFGTVFGPSELATREAAPIRRVASTTVPKSAVREPAPPQPVATAGDTARQIQVELKRLGCYTGPIDGAWGTDTRHAMRTVVSFANARLAVSEPNFILLALARSQGERVCAGTCRSGDGRVCDVEASAAPGHRTARVIPLNAPLLVRAPQPAQAALPAARTTAQSEPDARDRKAMRAAALARERRKLDERQRTVPRVASAPAPAPEVDTSEAAQRRAEIALLEARRQMAAAEAARDTQVATAPAAPAERPEGRMSLGAMELPKGPTNAILPRSVAAVPSAALPQTPDLRPDAASRARQSDRAAPHRARGDWRASTRVAPTRSQKRKIWVRTVLQTMTRDGP